MPIAELKVSFLFPSFRLAGERDVKRSDDRVSKIGAMPSCGCSLVRYAIILSDLPAGNGKLFPKEVKKYFSST
jgi:hypothetical protein